MDLGLKDRQRGQGTLVLTVSIIDLNWIGLGTRDFGLE